MGRCAVISFLRGRLLGVEDAQILVEVQGVGYEVSVPAGVLKNLPALGQDVEIYTHLHVRDDCLQLYGFLSPQDRAVFRILLKTRGIGPRVAQTILDTFSGKELSVVISQEDLASLQRVPGVGKKTAQRLILELKGKLPEPVYGVETRGAALPVLDEAAQALLALGYTRQEVSAVIQKMSTERIADLSVQELLKVLLKELGRGKKG